MAGSWEVASLRLSGANFSLFVCDLCVVVGVLLAKNGDLISDVS